MHTIRCEKKFRNLSFHCIFFLFIELATEAEARKVLYAIYELRKNETNIDQNELNIIIKCLSMIHFLSKEHDKVDLYLKLI